MVSENIFAIVRRSVPSTPQPLPAPSGRSYFHLCLKSQKSKSLMHLIFLAPLNGGFTVEEFVNFGMDLDSANGSRFLVIIVV